MITAEQIQAAGCHYALNVMQAENDRLREALRTIGRYLDGGYPGDQIKDIREIVQNALK